MKGLRGMLGLGLTAAAGAAMAAEPVVVKLSVLRDGQVLMNGSATTPAALDTKLEQARRARGVVWYYREDAASQPPKAEWAAAQAVLDHVTKYRLPISFSVKADFSDVVNATTGVSEPRKTQ